MLNKLLKFIRQQDMIQPGDRVICVVSGGADSVALLFALYLLKEKLDLQLEAAHFNHRLRGAESNRDEAFVREFCCRYDIPLHLGSGNVIPGKKGLEAAARDARYGFLRSLPGKIATAHTADDNAETVLMHLIRGTGLKGLGGITPVQGQILRPMLTVTRQEVEAFLEEWCLNHIEDSSNQTDAFLRNRIRHHVIPLLYQENPRIGENLSQMAMRLRKDEEFLSAQANFETLPTVEVLKAMPAAQRSRCLGTFLERNGVLEPGDKEIAMAEALVFSQRPSAEKRFRGGVTIARCYDRLEARQREESWEETLLPCPGEVRLPGFLVTCAPAQEMVQTGNTFTVQPQGDLILSFRRSGDSLRLSGGTKSLKRILIDRKIPAARRSRIPVLRDEGGILGVYSIGVNLDRAARNLPAVQIHFEKTEKGRETDGQGYAADSSDRAADSGENQRTG